MPYKNWKNKIGMEWMSLKDIFALTSMDSIMSINDDTHKDWFSKYVATRLIEVNEGKRFPDITDPCIKLESKTRELLVNLDDRSTYAYLKCKFKRNLLDLRTHVSHLTEVNISTDDFLVKGRTSFENKFSLTWIKNEV